MGSFLVVIPAACLLDNSTSILEKLYLALSFSLNGMGNGLEGV